MTLQNVFARMSVIAHLESGPLGSYLSGLASALGEQRYAVHTIQKCMHAADAFGRWLTKQKIELGDVDEQVVNRYVAGLQRRAASSQKSSIGRRYAVRRSHNRVSLPFKKNVTLRNYLKIEKTCDMLWLAI
jgi:site-specific recombinase XerD